MKLFFHILPSLLIYAVCSVKDKIESVKSVNCVVNYRTAWGWGDIEDTLFNIMSRKSKSRTSG